MIGYSVQQVIGVYHVKSASSSIFFFVKSNFSSTSRIVARSLCSQLSVWVQVLNVLYVIFQMELQSLSVMGSRLSHRYKMPASHTPWQLQSPPYRESVFSIQPLDVSLDIARSMFSHNRYVQCQLSCLDGYSGHGTMLECRKPSYSITFSKGINI